METQHPLYRMVPKYVLLWNGASPDPKSETKLKALQTQVSIISGVFFLITWTIGLRFSFYSGLFVRSGGYEAGFSFYRSGRGGVSGQ